MTLSVTISISGGGSSVIALLVSSLGVSVKDGCVVGLSPSWICSTVWFSSGISLRDILCDSAGDSIFKA